MRLTVSILRLITYLFLIGIIFTIRIEEGTAGYGALLFIALALFAFYECFKITDILRGNRK